jgi:alanyl-tRNA synthetase
MGAAYPQPCRRKRRITEVLKVEEERFFETLANGMQILERGAGRWHQGLPGDVAFKLHDTYGFPLDLSADVCREHGVEVDVAGFDAAMERKRPRAARRASSRWTRRWSTAAPATPSPATSTWKNGRKDRRAVP